MSSLRKVFRSLPGHATVVDVSARDGLQAQSRCLSPAQRADWVRAVLGSGIPEVEAGSFVSAARVPQMAGAGELVARLRDVESRLWFLVPNAQGAAQALEAGVRNVVCLASATESHSRANLGRGVSEVTAELRDLAAGLSSAGARARVALSMTWVDPEDDPELRGRVLTLLEELRVAGFQEVTLCDTLGRASPRAVAELLEDAFDLFPREAVGVHLHDAYGNASAATLVALLLGVTRFDASIGGLGGCPFAPGARGNLATEPLVRLLHSLGVGTGVDEDALAAAAETLSSWLGDGDGAETCHGTFERRP